MTLFNDSSPLRQRSTILESIRWMQIVYRTRPNTEHRTTYTIRGALDVLNSAVVLLFSCQRKSCSVIGLLWNRVCVQQLKLLGLYCECDTVVWVVSISSLNAVKSEALLVSSSCASVKLTQSDSCSGVQSVSSFKMIMQFKLRVCFCYVIWLYKAFPYFSVICCLGSRCHAVPDLMDTWSFAGFTKPCSLSCPCSLRTTLSSGWNNPSHVWYLKPSETLTLWVATEKECSSVLGKLL